MTSLSLSILGPPFLVAFVAAGSCSFAIPPYIVCVCLRVWASIPFIPSSFLFVWAAPGCSLIPLLLRGGGGLLFFFGRWQGPLFVVCGFLSCCWPTERGRRVVFMTFVRSEAGSDPRGHLGVTWGVYLCAGKPPLADIILSHPPDLT